MQRKFRIIEGGTTDEQREQEQALAVLNWILYGKAAAEGDEEKARMHKDIAQELGRRHTPLEREQLRVIPGKKS